MLGLPIKDIVGRSAHEIEVCRRLWFCIGMIDTMTSIDHGFAPLLPLDSFAHPPLPMDDWEINPTSTAVTTNSRPFNDMSFMHVMNLATISYRKFCTPQEPSVADQWTDWHYKMSVIEDFERSVQDYTDRFSQSTNPLAQFIILTAKNLVLNLQLLLRRPPYKQANSLTPPWDQFDILKHTTQVLESHLQGPDDGKFAPWMWFYRGWVKWHVLAVHLTELCTPRQGALLKTAYTVAREVFDEYALRMHDSDMDAVWKPITKLMARVDLLLGSVSGAAEALPVQLFTGTPATQPSQQDRASDRISWASDPLQSRRPQKRRRCEIGSVAFPREELTGIALGPGEERHGADLHAEPSASANWNLFLDDVHCLQGGLPII